jgi:hypothetical protein
LFSIPVRSSYGEHGSRGLRFILDGARINFAISRAKCLAMVVADPRIANAVARLGWRGEVAESLLQANDAKL